MTRGALGLAAFALASSVLATPGPANPAHAEAATAVTPPIEVVLVTLDGTRFREIFDGTDAELAHRQGLPESELQTAEQLMPELHRLMRDGVALGAPGHGEPISASGPDFVSLPGYSEIFTGRRVSGCSSNACDGVSAPSFADQLAERAPSAFASVVVTSWPDIARVAAKSERVTISAGKHAGATRFRFDRAGALGAALHRAEAEPPWPGHGDFRRDRFTAELALEYLKAETPGFLFVGLGETDEFAHQGNYAGYLAALREADANIGKLAALLATRASHGTRTALIVTADHGRSIGFRDHGQPFPESARVWLVASGSAVEPLGVVASPTKRHLADIAPSLRALFGLPADHDSSAGASLPELFGASHK